MKAHARADIEAEVGVMHAVQSPQPLERAHRPVLRMDQLSQCHQAEDAGSRSRQPRPAGAGMPCGSGRTQVHRSTLPSSRLGQVPRPAPFGEAEQGRQVKKRREPEAGVMPGVR